MEDVSDVSANVWFFNWILKRPMTWLIGLFLDSVGKRALVFVMGDVLGDVFL